MRRARTRRRVLGGIVAFTVPLAGCSGAEGGSDGTTTGTESATDTVTPTPTDTATPTPTDAMTTAEQSTETMTATPTDTPTPTETTGGGGVSAVDEYLADTSNYDGTIVDRTGQGSVTIMVGAEGNGGGFAYAPPAVRVDTGTTITWEWTGGGGLHNVIAEDGTFDSGDPVSGTGVSFKYTFTQSWTHLYYCNPHKALGMKGAVVVA
jgi:halocyanin-like protein